MRLYPSNNPDGGPVEAGGRGAPLTRSAKKDTFSDTPGLRGNQLVIPGDQT
jgi:hypothetical protein